MSFPAELIARQVYQLVAAKKIVAVATCMTRLRITLADNEDLPISELKAIAGILGVVAATDQLQIIIGPGKVSQVYQHFMPLLASGTEDSSKSAPAITTKPSRASAAEIKQKIKQKNSTPFKLFLKKLANIFIPMIPAFIGCGLILGLFNILNKSLTPEMLGGVAFAQTSLGALMKLIGSSITFGLAIFTGINAAKEFGGSPIYGGVLAAILTMPDLATVSVFGVNALPGRGGIIAVLLVTILAALIEKKCKKIVPLSLDLFLTPLIVILVSGVLAIYLLQPLGGIVSDAITSGVKLALVHGGIVTGFILGAFFLPLVMTGLHQGLTPIHAELISSSGVTLLLPILAMAGGGQVGSTLAVWAKTKNAKLRHIIKSGIFVGLLGVGEPLIYGVTLPLFRPFIGACIGGGIGGAVVALFKLGASGMGISGIPLALLIPNGALLYLSGLLAAYAGGFIATWLLGFDDSIFE